MSECSAETLVRRGHKIQPISVVEIEISPFSYDPEARKVIDTAKELGVTAWFQEENIRHNFAIVDVLTRIAEKKDVTAAQLCIAWVSTLGPHVIPLPGSSHVKRTLENCAAGGITLTGVELQEINQLIETADVKGTKYTP